MENRTMSKNPDTTQVPGSPDQIVARVRERYGRIAASGDGCGCCAGGESEVAERLGYDAAQIDVVPEGANLGLGCGAPIQRLKLQTGEVVLDLGSGGGIDAFLASSRVGPRGRVIGIDMTSEMIERARENALGGKYVNVEFRLGRLEQLPVEDASVDAVTSNCVINLVPDKGLVFEEVARVLRPGGRMVISDILLDGELPEVLSKDLLAYVGCVAGAMQRDDYFDLVKRAGLGDVRIHDDKDYLTALGEELLPEELRSFMKRNQIDFDAIAGRVRSVTFGATRS
jgi:arsenite methyltransferase